MIDSIKSFLRWEAAGGVMLVFASFLALVAANSPLGVYYAKLLSLNLTISIETWGLSKPLLLWINDGLMAVFFLMVGLELKREWMCGELATKEQRWLPAFCAAGGMAIPALVYLVFNWGDLDRVEGWAIPAATDIAFALGVLSLLGNRIPVSLKIFLVSLAIIDDIGAIVIIALFYSGELSQLSIAVAAVALVALYVINRRGVTSLSVYIIIGLVLWVSVLKSGVHATLAGIALAMFIPLENPQDQSSRPAEELEHDLHFMVAFIILPIFAFANAGVSLSGVEGGSYLDGVALGVFFGLVLGKPVGIVLGALLADHLAPRPPRSNK